MPPFILFTIFSPKQLKFNELLLLLLLLLCYVVMGRKRLRILRSKKSTKQTRDLIYRTNIVCSMKVSIRTKVFIALCILAVLAAAEKYVDVSSSLDTAGNAPVSGVHQKSHYYNPLPDDLEQDPIHPDKHKDLYPLDSADIWGTILVTLGLLVAASGGIGGGGILVPLFILIFEFKPKYAIPLSNFCILGSSITNMILNLSKRHPSVNRPLVDWDLILMMEPLTMAGAVSPIFSIVFF
jgi:hypothetical protein